MACLFDLLFMGVNLYEIADLFDYFHVDRAADSF